MKLSEIMTSTPINEGRVPVMVKMVIAEIPRYGKITNTVQAYELANAITFLQQATDPTEWMMLDEFSGKTLNANLVKKLQDADPRVQVCLANEVLDIMASHDKIGVIGTSQATADFMRGVLHAQ